MLLFYIVQLINMGYEDKKEHQATSVIPVMPGKIQGNGF